MSKKDFCCVENYSVLIPYKDLEKLVNLAQKTEEVLELVKKVDERYAALQLQYTEAIEKIQELSEML